MDLKNLNKLLKRLNIALIHKDKRFKSYEGNKLYIVYDKLFNSVVIHTLDHNGMINPLNTGHLSISEAIEELKLM